MAGNETAALCAPLFNDNVTCVVLLAIRSVFGAFSLLGSCFVVAVIILFKKYQFVTQRFILYLSISAFFQALVYGSGNFYTARSARMGNKGFCILQAYFTLFFDWTSFIWVLCITFNVFFTVVFFNHTKKVELFEKMFLIADIVIPIVICCFPFIHNSYGSAGLWCWISSLRNGEPFVPGIIFQFVLFYGPLWLLSFVMLTTLLIVFCTLWRRKYLHRYGMNYDSELHETTWRKEIKPIVFFPLVYMAILLFPSINRLRLAGGYAGVSYAADVFFWLMHSITLPLHGAMYALIFGLDRDTLSRLKWSHVKAAFADWFRKTSEEYPIGENKQRESVYKKRYAVMGDDSMSPLDDSVNLSYSLIDGEQEEDGDRSTY